MVQLFYNIIIELILFQHLHLQLFYVPIVMLLKPVPTIGIIRTCPFTVYGPVIVNIGPFV